MSTQNIYDMADTWNSAGTTFTAIKMDVTDTASASGSLLMDLQVGGVSQFYVRKDGFTRSAQNIEAAGGNFVSSSDTGGLFFGSSADAVFRRDAANTLAQRNSTNAQAFRIYNTYTDASNYERGFLRWVGNEFQIGSEAAGTGVGRTVAFFGQGALGLSLGSSTFSIHSRNLLFASDNTNDIGASNANRPRNVHVAGYVSIGDGITAPGAGTGQARIYVDSADGDLKVVFADGTIKTIVTDT